MLAMALLAIACGCGCAATERGQLPAMTGMTLDSLVGKAIAGVDGSPPGQEVQAASIALTLPYEGDGYMISSTDTLPKVAAVYSFSRHPCLGKPAVEAAMENNGFVLVPNLDVYFDGYDPRQLMKFEKKIAKGFLLVHFAFGVADTYRCASTLFVDGISSRGERR